MKSNLFNLTEEMIANAVIGNKIRDEKTGAIIGEVVSVVATRNGVVEVAWEGENEKGTLEIHLDREGAYIEES